MEIGGKVDVTRWTSLLCSRSDVTQSRQRTTAKPRYGKLRHEFSDYSEEASFRYSGFGELATFLGNMMAILLRNCFNELFRNTLLPILDWFIRQAVLALKLGLPPLVRPLVGSGLW